jgi:hypothetical protein
MQVSPTSGRLGALFVVVFSTALVAFWASYVPPRVNVRWREGVTPAVRASLEAEHRLTQARNAGDRTWSYAFGDTSTDSIRRLVQDPDVEDTHYIDRSRFTLTSEAAPTPFFGPRWFVGWSALIGAASVGMVVWARRGRWWRLRAMLQRARAASAKALATVRSDVQATDPLLSQTAVLHANDGRHWTIVAMAVSAPLVLVLCITLWRTPFPITEIVALLEDVTNEPTAVLLSPDTTYYRPLYHLTLSSIWHSGTSLETRLAAIKLATIVPVVVLLLGLIWHVRPRTAAEAAAAIFAVGVLAGSGGFRDNLEIGLNYTIVGMPLALIVWILLNRERRAWHTPLVIVLTLVAIGFKEQGLVLIPIVVVGWWTGAPGANRSMAAAATLIGVAYVVFRLSATGTWEAFEQDVGLGFSEMDRFTAAARFGAFPYWMYAYNGASTIANVLFAEPTRGVFRIVHAAVDDGLEPWHVMHLFSSVVLTAVIAWWGLGSLKSAVRSQWSLESRLFVVMVVVLLASGLLSFNYSRDRLGGMAAVFYALAAFFTVRTAAARISRGPGFLFATVALLLMLVAGAWQLRAIATVEWARAHAVGNNQREWFVLLPERRVTFARRTTYIEIMESMVAQGTDAAAPRPTRFPAWAHRILGQ